VVTEHCGYFTGWLLIDPLIVYIDFAANFGGYSKAQQLTISGTHTKEMVKAF
jgi:hypothetical protein